VIISTIALIAALAIKSITLLTMYYTPYYTLRRSQTTYGFIEV
jgi:hypothetical protein